MRSFQRMRSIIQTAAAIKYGALHSYPDLVDDEKKPDRYFLL